MASDDHDSDGSVVEGANAVGSDRVAEPSGGARVFEIAPRAIPAHLSSTGSHGTKAGKAEADANRSTKVASSSSTALGFGPHRSPEPKSSTTPGFGFADRAPANQEATSTTSSTDPERPATPRLSREALTASAFARMGSGVRRALRFAFGGPRAGLWSMLVLVCAMIVVGVSALAARHVDAWTLRPGDGGSMVVYLGDGVDDATAAKLVADLQRLPGVERAELVAAAESAARLQQALGGDASLMEGVDVGSLPASVEVTLAPGVRDVVAMSPTVRALRNTPGVDDVVLDEASEDRTSAALGTVRTVVWTGGALLAGLALIIALATIRLRLDRDPEEQRVAHMLGAGPAFLLGPTLLAGVLVGALAALLAAGAIVGALCAYGDGIVTALAGPLGAIELALPTACEIALFVGLGAALGFLGGGLAGASRVAR